MSIPANFLSTVNKDGNTQSNIFLTFLVTGETCYPSATRRLRYYTTVDWHGVLCFTPPLSIGKPRVEEYRYPLVAVEYIMVFMATTQPYFKTSMTDIVSHIFAGHLRRI